MHNERESVPRGRIVGYGAARVTGAEPPEATEQLESQADRLLEHALLVDFGDAQTLQEAVNSGFAVLDMGDDTVAVALVEQRRRDDGSTAK